MYSFKPLGNNILIDRIGSDNLSAGGIHLPHAEDSLVARGTVVAIGPGAHDSNGEKITLSDVKVGDSVLFSKHSVREIKIAIKDASDPVAVDYKQIIGVIA